MKKVIEKKAVESNVFGRKENKIKLYTKIQQFAIITKRNLSKIYYHFWRISIPQLIELFPNFLLILHFDSPLII